jgi:DNA-binding transcriptional ArsR family regulator
MVGKDIDNVVSGVVQIGGKELYPIISRKFEDASRGGLLDALHGVTIHREFEGRVLVVDPFMEDAFERIVDLVIDIALRNKKDGWEVWVNITGGTNLMSAAAEAGAVLSRSVAYYVVEPIGDRPSEVITLPWHSIESKLDDPVKMRILKVLADSPKRNTDIIADMGREMTPRSITYHLKNLEQMGYITRTREGRNVFNRLTFWGRVILRINQ